MEGTFRISDEEMENIPQTAQAAVVKGDFHNESLDDPEKESAGKLCVHPHIAHRVQETPTVHSFGLEHPLVERAPALLFLNTAFDLPDSGSYNDSVV